MSAAWTNRIGPRTRDRRRNHLAYAPGYDESNVNDDHGRPGRQDYTVLLLPAETLTLAVTAGAFGGPWTARRSGVVGSPSAGWTPRRVVAEASPLMSWVPRRAGTLASGLAAWASRAAGAVASPTAGWAMRRTGTLTT